MNGTAVTTPLFDLGRQPYIALVTRSEVEALSDDPVHLALYAPGTACAFYASHGDGAASLHYGFLLRERGHYGRWTIIGPDCLESTYAHTNPHPWVTVLNQRHPLAGTGLGSDWREQTRRSYWRLVPLVGLILQVEPHLGILRGYLERMTQKGKRALTVPEKRTLLDMLRKRGATEWARYRGQWRRELAAHRQVIQRRRDLAFRLARLAALDLSPQDRAKVLSLQSANVAWQRGRMASLTPAQQRLVVALEAQYLEQRAAAALALAQVLAGYLRLSSPKEPCDAPLIQT